MDAPANSTLPLRRIVQGKNPRTYFDPAEMADLRAGLKAAGRVVQPIIVRPIPGASSRSWPASAAGAQPRRSSATTTTCPS